MEDAVSIVTASTLRAASRAPVCMDMQETDSPTTVNQTALINKKLWYCWGTVQRAYLSCTTFRILSLISQNFKRSRYTTTPL